jgi:PRTRC genetic system protein C
MQTTTLKRRFKIGGVTIDDPKPGANLEDVRKLLAMRFPEIMNWDIDEPVVSAKAITYEFRRAVGTKGGAR